MIKILNDADCCGCAVCAEVCPSKCITMSPGTLGALFPSVDEARCLQCGRCDAVCPLRMKLPGEPAMEQKAYAAYAADPDDRYSGSSGGVFPVLAKKVLEMGGVVYGAAFDRELQLKCTAAATEEELRPLFKSKYLQSDMQRHYKEIQELLKNGKLVFVTATPCQIAALKSFLGDEYDNLVTADFFCHGVPSQEFFNRCRQYEQEKYGCTITEFIFREKVKNGATPHYFRITYQKNGAERSVAKLYFYSAFYAAFQRYITLRESCYSCRYAGAVRCSDITIGDFHSIERYIKGINRFEGISTIVVNTPKGADMLKECQQLFRIETVDLQTLQKNGDCFAGPTVRPKDRNQFTEALERDGFEQVMKSWFSPGKYWKNNLYYHLPKMIRKVIRRLRFGD